MKLSSTEFTYWLQGAIEIGGIDKFTKRQTELIKQRVREVEKDSSFTFTLKILLLTFKYNQLFDTINKELQKIFIHDIDPSYEGDQEHFHAIHKGELEE